MKKVLFIVAVATLGLISCQKEKGVANSVGNDNFTFNVSIGELSTPTKATINGSYQFLWASGDKIGLYLNNSWDDKHQPFTLVGEGGSSSGSFAWDYGAFSDENAIIAYFPWEGLGIDKNNYSDGKMYFKLHDAYDGYTSGKLLTPLVARVTRSAGNYDPIEFEHAGAAVKVTINNLPAGSHSIGLNAGQQVNGTYHVTPAAAPSPVVSANMTFDEAWGGLANPNAVWLKFDPTASERAFTFIFPVPALADDSDLSVSIYDENDVLVWSRTASDQPAINHGEILVMPALNVTPYRQFDAIDANWGIVTSADWDSTSDTKMVTDGTLCIAQGFTFEADQEFKVRKDNAWGESFGGAQLVTSKSNNASNSNGNIKVSVAGTYDVIFNSSSSAYGDYGANEIRVVTSKCPYPSASGFGKGSNLDAPKDLTDASWGTYYN